MSTKVNVNVRIDKDLKEEASNLAKSMGTNLSTVLNMYLVKFSREKRLDISIDDDIITSVSDNEIKQIKSLDNYNTFISSISGK